MSGVGTYLPGSSSPLKEGKFMHDITTGNSFSTTEEPSKDSKCNDV
jgi:hypothetical protein